MKSWLKKLQPQAERLLQDPERLQKLVSEAQSKTEDQKKKAASFLQKLKALAMMVQAYWKGEYREVPYQSVFSAVLALLYFVNPLDLLPDVLLFGFVDDAVVVGMVFSSIKSDVDNYLAWSDRRGV